MYRRIALSILLTIFMAIITTTALASNEKCYGLYMGDKITTKSILNKGKEYGATPCAIQLFWGWNEIATARTSSLERIWKAGAIPIITVEPFKAGGKEGIPLSSISGGNEDAVLKSLGELIKAFDHPVIVRFAHEMNGNWYPWSGLKNGKSARAYIKAYRHVHRVVSRTTGGSDIIWVWSINRESVPNKSWNRAENYYPGDKYVDLIGIDGYNWGNSRSWSRFMSFDEIFYKPYTEMKRLHPSKPIAITEIATGGNSGVKAKWIDDMFKSIDKRYGDMILLSWFDVNKELDWRISSGALPAKAFKTMVKDNFNCGREKLIQRVTGGKAK